MINRARRNHKREGGRWLLRKSTFANGWSVHSGYAGVSGRELPWRKKQGESGPVEPVLPQKRDGVAWTLKSKSGNWKGRPEEKSRLPGWGRPDNALFWSGRNKQKQRRRKEKKKKKKKEKLLNTKASGVGEKPK